MGIKKRGAERLFWRIPHQAIARYQASTRRTFGLIFGSRSLCLLVACMYLLVLASVLPALKIQNASAAGTVGFGGATTASNNSGTSLTINKPTTTVSGDVLVAIISTQGQDPAITPPTGWTSFKEIVNGSTNFAMEAFWKVADGSEPSSYIFGTGGGNTRWAGGISVYKGVGLNSGDPIDVNGTTSTTTHAAPSVTTTTVNSRVVSVYVLDHASPQTFTAPSGTKERFDVSSSDGSANDTAVMLADITQYAAGASGIKTATPSASTNAASFQFALKSDSVVRMLLFWDGTNTSGTPIDVPTGWTLVDDYDGMYPRGEDPANFGATGGSMTHAPTLTGAGQGYVNGGNSNNLSSGNNNVFPASQGHGHGSYAGGTFGGTPAASNHEPTHRTLRLIRYDSGVPNVIPNGAIALFDDSPNTTPTGWTNLSGTTDPFYQRIIKLDATANTNGGADTHQHSVTWNSLVASTATTEGANPLLANGTPASNGHTHNAPATSSTPAVNHLPPYVGPRLAKAGLDTETISIGITGMFDGDPGGGWVTRSKSSGLSSETIYYQKFLRPTNVFNGAGGQGNAAHSHANFTSGNSGTNIGALGNNSNLNLSIPPAISGTGHAHTITLSFAPNDSNLPTYFNIVIAEKVNFIMTNYYWMYDNSAQKPTDIWSNPDVGLSSPIVVLPIGSADPPDLGEDMRLRIQILINGNNLAANAVAFRLQYNATRSSSCVATTGTWVDVGASTDTTKAWRYTTSTSVTSGESLTLDTVASGGHVFTASPDITTVTQQYIRGINPGTNPRAAVIGDYIEYDFHINHFAAQGATQYSFRVIESTGTLLSQYDFCPTLTTRPRTENQLRHGNFFSPNPGGEGTGSLEGGFSWAD